MRVFVLVLSLIGALAMIDHALIPSRLTILAGSELRTLEQAGSISLFSLWAIAAGLVYCYPSVALWFYAVAGGIGLYAGFATDYRVLVIWGVLANGLAILTTFARREKSRSDRRDHDRDQQLLAIGLAMPRLESSLAESLKITGQREFVELLFNVPANGIHEESESRTSGTISVAPGRHGVADASIELT